MHKRLLLTGVSGFIGAHFLRYFLINTDYDIVGIDSFRHKGTYSRLNAIDEYIKNKNRVSIYHHDLTVPIDRVLCNQLGTFDYIVNLASNSAVERSISDPAECWKNNCDLISNVLEYVRCTPCNPGQKFIQISTDEVYGDYSQACSDEYITDDRTGFQEWSTIIPSNPYAASKAAQEALCIAYWRTYNMPIILTNTMNNVGEWQDTEKFLPKLISNIAQGKEVQIYTDNEGSIGKRVYLDALEHASAIHFLLEHHEPLEATTQHKPSRFNVCGDIELDNLELAMRVAKLMERELNFILVPAKSARPGYDKTYLLDPTWLCDLGWEPKCSFDKTLKRIIDYSLQNPWWIN